jgi:ANTAR domain
MSNAVEFDSVRRWTHGDSVVDRGDAAASARCRQVTDPSRDGKDGAVAFDPMTPDSCDPQEANMIRPGVAPPTTMQGSGSSIPADEFEALRRENAVLREALATRKVIELGKALLMLRDGLSEPAAHRYIQKSSMNARVPMVEIARALIPAATGRPGRVTTAGVRRSPWAATASRPDALRALSRRWAGSSTPTNATGRDDLDPTGARG